MHPPRRKRTIGEPGLIDRMVDRLLTRCPFTTLTVLTLVVVSPAVGPVPQPLYLAISIVMADFGLNLIRATPRKLRRERPARS
jgi:hypothetical protein